MSLSARERNAIAAASRGNLASVQAANRERILTARADLTARQSRNTLATPPKAPAGFRGSKGRRAGSDKGQGEWRTVSQNYRTAATHDVRWSATVHTNPSV